MRRAECDHPGWLCGNAGEAVLGAALVSMLDLVAEVAHPVVLVVGDLQTPQQQYKAAAATRDSRS